MVEKGSRQNPSTGEENPDEVRLTEEVLVNPAYPEQLVRVGGNLSKECNIRLRALLKRGLEEWLNAVMVRPIKYPTWIFNHALVKKADGRWRMCIDFKNINSVCLKDYYPLLDIDGKIESVVESRYKCFLYAYEGYHQVQMAQYDEEKTVFYMDQGKSKKDKGRHGHAIPQNTKRDAKLKRQAGRPEQENKDEYRWTKEAKRAFQEMKKLIIELPLLTTPRKEEVLYVYLVAATEAVSTVLLTKGNGKQCLIHYVRITLNEPERNYAPMEKLALSLLYMSQRLRRCFEGYPIKVITDQPIKKILNKAQASGKLAKYSIELGAYNITYEPRNAIKGRC
ncbi:reverse transcriptase domain-containing protein [Tanacetum coccineum]